MRVLSMRGPLLALAVVAAVASGSVLAASCAGDDDDSRSDITPTVSATGRASATAATASASPGSATASPTATATVSAAERLGASPGYILYRAGEGDTIPAVAAAFSATTGQPATALAARIRQENNRATDELQPGDTIAVPLMLPGDLAILPENSLEAALGVGIPGKGGPLLLLQPSLDLRDGYLGKLVLHRVQLATGTPAGEGYGYVMEYWTADRPTSKGGVPDPEARVAEAQFVVAAGSLAPTLTSERPGDLQTFTRDGVTYAVKMLARAPAAAQVADQLEPAAQR